MASLYADCNKLANSMEVLGNLNNSTLYVTLFPCNECAKLIIQCGIKEIVYVLDKYDGTDSSIASKKMLDAAGIKYRQMKAPKLTLTYE